MRLDNSIRKAQDAVGAFVADILLADRTYLKPGEKPPKGVGVQQGKRGGRYYEGPGGPGEPAHNDPSERFLYPHAPKQEAKPRFPHADAFGGHWGKKIREAGEE
jgi:hypothetical protein